MLRYIEGPTLREILSRESALSRAFVNKLALQLVEALTAAHREVLTETVLRDRTVNEAAEILGIPVGTVKSRVYYALKALRVVLAERGVPV